MDGIRKNFGFGCMPMLNARQIYHNWNTDDYYNVYTAHGGKASECIKSGKYERACPGI